MGNMQKTQDWNVPKLGFGMMRLPKRDDGQIDMEQVEKMVDLFLARGFRYVDTAYGYMNSQSEACVGRALTARHPRESFLLATKLPRWARGIFCWRNRRRAWRGMWAFRSTIPPTCWIKS